MKPTENLPEEEQDNFYSAPQADLIALSDSENLQIFKRLSAWFVFFLVVFSLGIYNYFWLYLRTRTLNTYTINKIPEALIYSIITLFIATTALDVYSAFVFVDPQILEINQMVYYPLIIMNTFWAFMVRSRLSTLIAQSQIFGLHISGPMTFFFGGIYLQYKINEGLDALNSEYNYST